MSEEVRAIAMAGVVERDPLASPREHELELFRIILGDGGVRRSVRRRAFLKG